jgi:MFS family permease
MARGQYQEGGRGGDDAIDHLVMAITSARASGRHTCSHGRREIPRLKQGSEKTMMIALITFALFAIALALFGLIALVVDARTIDQSRLLSDLWKQ